MINVRKLKKYKTKPSTLLFTLPLSALEELIKETDTCGATEQGGR